MKPRVLGELFSKGAWQSSSKMHRAMRFCAWTLCSVALLLSNATTAYSHVHASRLVGTWCRAGPSARIYGSTFEIRQTGVDTLEFSIDGGSPVSAKFHAMGNWRFLLRFGNVTWICQQGTDPADFEILGWPGHIDDLNEAGYENCGS